MAATPHSQAPLPLADDGSNHLLLEVARTIRDNLHILFGMSLVFLVVALPWVILATLTSWAMAWLPLLLATAPVWATLVASADRLLAGEAVHLTNVGKDFRSLTIPAISIGMVPALCGTVFLAAATEPFDGSWIRMAGLASAGVAMATLLLMIPAMPLAIRNRLSGLTLWQASAIVVIKRPTQMMGTLAVMGIGLWLTLVFGPAFLLGTAPLAVLVAATTLPNSE